MRILSNLVPLIRSLPPLLGGLVLLLATLNVSNILLARTAARQTEMAVRAALGASRVRLIRHLLTESLLWAVLGSVGGIIVGRWASSAFAASIDFAIDAPVRLDFSFDTRVFCYVLLCTLSSGILIGIWPALRVSRTELTGALRDGSRGSSGPQSQRIQALLVVAQIAGSLVLLICAGLFMRTLQSAQRVDLGFAPDHLLNLRINPKWAGYDKVNSSIPGRKRRAVSLRPWAFSGCTPQLRPYPLTAFQSRSIAMRTDSGLARTRTSSVRFTQRIVPVASMRNSAGRAMSLPASPPLGCSTPY